MLRAAAARISVQRDGVATARRRGDGAEAGRGSGVPPEGCAPHRPNPSLPRHHAGGICDFPDAAVHVFADELRAASHRVDAWRAKPLSRRADRLGQEMGGSPGQEGGTWFGFSAVRAIPGTRDEVLLVPLPEHPHVHIAASPSGARTISCSIAATPISITPKSSRICSPAPKGVRFFELLVQFDGAVIPPPTKSGCVSSARTAAGEVQLICSHDPSDVLRPARHQRQAEAAPQPVSARKPTSAPQPVQQRDLRRRPRPANQTEKLPQHPPQFQGVFRPAEGSKRLILSTRTIGFRP